MHATLIQYFCDNPFWCFLRKDEGKQKHPWDMKQTH